MEKIQFEGSRTEGPDVGRGSYKKARGSNFLEMCTFETVKSGKDTIWGSRTMVERLGEMMLESIFYLSFCITF